MKRLLGYGKKMVSLMCAVMIVAVGIFSTSFDSNASAAGVNNGVEFFVNYAEPATSDYEGYITLLLRNNITGEYAVETLFWYCCATFNDYINPCFMTIEMTPYAIQFAPGGNYGAEASYSITDIDPTGRFSALFTSSTSRYNLNFAGYNWTIMAYKYAGNVNGFNASGINNSANLFSVYFSEDGSAMLLMDIISLLHSINNTDSSILSTVYSILLSVDGVENQLSSVISYLQSVDLKLSSISSQLQSIYNKAEEILNEQKKSNTWLGKIWDSIQEFFNPDSADKNKTDSFQTESESQKNEIDDLNEQNQTEKVDVNNAVSDVEANINYDDMAQYGGVLATITNNEYILQLILVVVSIAIIAYVLFGKR